MSTFAVFGMTKTVAITEAQKKTPAGAMSETQWLKKVDETVETIMRGKRVKQLSAAFDAPQFAEEFMHIALRMEVCRDMSVKARQVVTDAHGKPVYTKRGKSPKKAWLPYQAKRA
ncbi:MAG TPA: hypothetical protein VN731_10220 [Rhodanobacter sp.]|nr:hypothetical protein [Rhodanobacter sp.]